MIGGVERRLRWLRRAVSRSEWAARLLRLPGSEEPPTAHGLVLIQIDGLSQTQLRRALTAGRMPFLRRLMKDERYRLHRLYSGLPASTPAFQGELFYGVKAAVPAFGFRDPGNGEIVRMFEPAAAAAAEKAIAQHGEPLLAGGSSYSNVFTGGADEAHFCPSALGWGAVLRQANPFALAFLLLANAFGALRVLGLMLLEVALAVVDFVRGLIAGQDLGKELKFVPTRVAICVLLRELVRTGAEIDVARGLPVVHLNLLGYDEQAHRRGPSSAFAHWALKGIDRTVAGIWRAAHRSARRQYEVWIYSDHGQEEVAAYDRLAGRSIQQAAAEAFAGLRRECPAAAGPNGRGVQSQRARILGGDLLQRLLPVYPENRGEEDGPVVAAYGPLGWIYPPGRLSPRESGRMAEALAVEHKVPLVLVREGGRVRAWTEDGTFILPDQADLVFGRDHPFLPSMSRDLSDLCHHPAAGPIAVAGWRAGAAPISFAIESGAHGGLGPEETAAFALLPCDAPLDAAAAPYLRALDLREAALAFLGRGGVAAPARPRRAPATRRTLRLMTYNVHSCVGMDGRLSAERIARVVARHDPDIVALQELDVSRLRTGGMDQAHHIARLLAMEFHFNPAMRVEEELYGDAILSRLPMRLVRAGPLPGLRDRPGLEPRGALWTAVDIGGVELQVINTHLGLRPRERALQAEALLGPGWLGHRDCRDPVVLMGDFNAVPSSGVYRQISRRLADAQEALSSHRPKCTWSGRLPAARIDHVFLRGLEVVGVEVPLNGLTRVASDHLPLLAEVAAPASIERTLPLEVESLPSCR